MTLINLRRLSCILFTLAVPTSQSLATLAISAPGTGDETGNSDSSNTYGWVFTVGTTELLVSALGVWDQGQDGLLVDHPVGIWSSEGDLLAIATIPSQTNAPLVGQFRMQALPSALSLAAGASYTIGALFQGDDSFNGSTGTVPTVSPFISNLESRYATGQTLMLPTFGPADGAGPTPFVGPTFEFAAVPEPTSLVLFGIAALAGLGTSRYWRGSSRQPDATTQRG